VSSKQASIHAEAATLAAAWPLDRGTQGGQGVCYWPYVWTLLTEELRAVLE